MGEARARQRAGRPPKGNGQRLYEHKVLWGDSMQERFDRAWERYQEDAHAATGQRPKNPGDLLEAIIERGLLAVEAVQEAKRKGESVVQIASPAEIGKVLLRRKS